jgi:NAD-dependent histone deacetylase SIR2
VLFNLERAGDLGTRADDVLALETCDSGVRTLAHLLGWEEELDAEWAATALPKDPATSEGEEDEVRKLTEDIGHALRLNESDETSGEVEDKPAPADEVKFPNSADEKDSEASVPKQEKSISSADNGDVREGKL